MGKHALIVFVKPPELGKVKSRLAATIGEQAALSVYQKLLLHTQQVIQLFQDTSTADCFVFYAGRVPEADSWSALAKEQNEQKGSDLGERMYRAFAHCFAQGYSRVCIIGSDCPELTTSVIVSAFNALQDYPATIGPATDGGYYLLGLRKNHPSLFEKMTWSTDTVFTETMKRLKNLHWEVTTLPALTDIDTEADLQKFPDFFPEGYPL